MSNSGQKGSHFILKNSLKIGFIVGCCFFFFFFSKRFSCSSCCCRGSKVPLYYWAWMSRPCPPVLGSMGVSKGGLCADMVIPGCDEGPPCISMAWGGWWWGWGWWWWWWWGWSGRYAWRGGLCRSWEGWEVIWWGLVYVCGAMLMPIGPLWGTYSPGMPGRPETKDKTERGMNSRSRWKYFPHHR